MPTRTVVPQGLERPSPQEIEELRSRLESLPKDVAAEVIHGKPEQTMPTAVDEEPIEPIEPAKRGLDKLEARAALAQFQAQVAQMLPWLRLASSHADGELATSIKRAYERGDGFSEALISAQGDTHRET